MQLTLKNVDYLLCFNSVKLHYLKWKKYLKKNLIITWSSVFAVEPDFLVIVSSTPVRSSIRSNIFLKCEKHNSESMKMEGKDLWLKSNDNYNNCVIFQKLQQLLKNRQRCCLIAWLNRVILVMLENTINLNMSIHWIFLSVYRWTIKAVKLKINKLLTEYIYLKNYRKKSRAIAYYKKRFDFIADMDRLFNIDADEIQTNSKSCFGVKTSFEDYRFFEKQRRYNTNRQ